MTLEKLRAKRGAEAQLYPLLEKIGARVWDYKRWNEETTEMLAEAGLVARPKPTPPYKGAYKGAMENTLEAILNLKEGQHLLIPSDSGIFPSERASKIPTHLVERYPTGGAQNTLYMRVGKMADSIAFPTGKLGYDWQRTSDGTICVSYLAYSVLAKILLEDIGESLLVRDYTNPKDPSKNYRQGGNVLVENVPSISEPGKTYKVQLMGAPVFSLSELSSHGVPTQDARSMNRDIKARGFPAPLAAQTFNLSVKDPCDNDIPLNMSYGRPFQHSEKGRVRKTNEELMDHHSILAYWALQEYLKESRPEFIAANIFYRPSEKEEDFFWKLYSQSLIEEQNPLTREVSRRPLGFAELETLLDNYRAYQNQDR